jgi:hypothetical protein
MIIVVLGMHKSGTTMVSQMLHRSGINMGESFDDGVSYDKGGHYERLSSQAVNMEILERISEAELFADPTAYELTDEQRQRMTDIIAECEQKYEYWGFKDPRTCITYPLWKPLLPPHRIVAVYRSAVEVWPRYRYNHRRYYHTNPSRACQFLRRWRMHNEGVYRYLTDGDPDYVLLNYNELVHTDEEFARLQDFVGLPINDVRRKDMHRSKAKRHPFLMYADTVLRWREGYDYRDTHRQLEQLREENLAKPCCVQKD